MKQLAFAIALALVPAALQAQRPVDEMAEIKAGTRLTVKPDKAYILFRIPRVSGGTSIEPILLRIPTAAEIERFQQAKAAAYQKALPELTEVYERAAQSMQSEDRAVPIPFGPSVDKFPFAWDEVENLQAIDFGDAYVKAPNENTYLVEVLPGDYVLYGLSLSMGLPRLLVCFCLGTVGFAVKPGQITDIGYLYGDFANRKSNVPELAAETGYGPSSVGLMTGTVRPARSDSSRPSGLAAETIVAADYKAVGKYFTPNAAAINRLVPVPGILGYDGGDVIDVKTGQVAPDNF